ncbi:MAG: Gfo/Idh/MocA family oxidoreductase [Planctomycetota bacterium]|nr:Gfo/Idh/MocA family oxidoreductase [Planctomycetota bacterium]
MSRANTTRRDFLKTSAALAAGSLPIWYTSTSAKAFSFKAANDRPVFGCIGTGSRWHGLGPHALDFGECAAVSDVDANHLAEGYKLMYEGQEKKGVNREVAKYEDYRELLDRKDIDAVIIATPDHWHSKIAIEAMLSGKDVYCEKPLTLTIEEGKQIIATLEKTGRVFQVGTQQRSEMEQRFLKAVWLARSGRLGKITKVSCAIGGAPTSSEIAVADVPEGLNWERWLGQAPLVDYRANDIKSDGGYPESRCHYEFRWWYEYSGGKMTDWGAHHVDIAQWAIGMENSGPLTIEGTATHPVPYENGYATDDTRYNTATEFNIVCQFPNDIELTIRHDTDNGILIEGTDGRVFVSRGALKGKPVEDLETNPIPEGALVELYKGREFGDHMRNYFESIHDREQPISDVYTHHRAITTCHLANIAIRLGRKLEWDAESQTITNDSEANEWQAREQRKGYEIVV